MPPGGWGRRAAGKADRKLEDDVLFKEIGGQLGGEDFDYAQWQRTARAAAGGARRPRPPLLKRGTGLGMDRPFTVGSGQTQTSTCQHQRKHPPTLVDKEAEKRRTEAIKILKLRIRARRQTLEDYRKRQMELLDWNMTLRSQIEDEERVAHEEVKSLLRKYDKFRGGISTLNGKFGTELSDAKDDLKKTKQETSQDLARVQAAVDTLDKQLQAQMQELNVLANYKDKEYPVKALRIADLNKEIEQLQLHNDEEEGELCHIVEHEIEKMQSDQQQLHMDIKEKATQDALVRLHPSLEDMALQNMVMEKEITFHMENHAELEATIRALEAEVKKLLQDPKSNIRLQMFPEFFPSEQKCTPDMDVVLNIPTQQWLPI